MPLPTPSQCPLRPQSPPSILFSVLRSFLPAFTTVHSLLAPLPTRPFTPSTLLFIIRNVLGASTTRFLTTPLDGMARALIAFPPEPSLPPFSRPTRSPISRSPSRLCRSLRLLDRAVFIAACMAPTPLSLPTDRTPPMPPMARSEPPMRAVLWGRAR